VNKYNQTIVKPTKERQLT